jgi:hypothetical protein
MGGLNTINAGSSMPPTDCVLLYNMLASENGLRARLGSREWCQGLTGAGDTFVRSIIPFKGSAANGSADKIFAMTSSGIWDVTSSGGVATVYDPTPSPDYEVGDHVSASSTSYAVKVAGTPHPTNGLPSVWAVATAYVVGNRAINDNSVYICTTSGTSSAVSGPTGTATGITDGTVVWDHESVSTAVSDGTVTWTHRPGNVSPQLVLSFSITAGRAGHGVSHVQVTSAGHFLLYWDEANGLHVYTQSTGLWAAVTLGGGAAQISGVDPANLVAGTVFKGRVIHVEASSGNLWYTAAGAVFGAAVKFAVGPKLKAGGPIRGVWNWTYDGGSGLDDSLVGISDGGDVFIYQGTDPASSDTFGMRGVWQLGDVPAGREIATDLGGDMLIATRMGLLPLSKLVVGQGVTSSQYATAKISSLFNALMLSKATTNGWSMRLHPEENALIVTVPEAEGTATTQLAMSLSTQSWSRLRDLPVYSSGVFGGKLYFGTVDGTVCINDGYVDGRALADPATYTPVQYAGLSSFQNLGSSRSKQIHNIRPYFVGESTAPSFSVEARYDFDFSELSSVTPGVGASNLWDTGIWDTSVWGGDYAPSYGVRGASGLGVNAAIAWRGTAVARTVLVGFDVEFEQGGFL